MTTMTPERVGVSLEALLAAKEKRAARQGDWLRHYQQPIISLTLVTPGAVKDTMRYRNTMGVALQACDQMLWQRGWQTLDRQVLWLPTGAEAMWCVAHPAAEIKAQCIELEQTHPLGRLWDFISSARRMARWAAIHWIAAPAAVWCAMNRRTAAPAPAIIRWMK